jgi:hypothetical protein
VSHFLSSDNSRRALTFANQIFTLISVVFVTFFAAGKARVLMGAIEVEAFPLSETNYPAEWSRSHFDRVIFTSLDCDEVISRILSGCFLPYSLLLPTAGIIII